MNLARILNYLAFLALFIAYVTTGYTVSLNGRYWVDLVNLNLPGKPLPGLTLFVFICDGSDRPIVVGVITGLIFVIGLGLLDRNAQTQKWVPFGLTVAWGLCVLHLLAFVWAVGLILPPDHMVPLPHIH